MMEQGTGKKTLVGVFEDLRSEGEPISRQQLGFFAKVTDLEGQYVFSIKVVRVSDEGEIEVASVNLQMPQLITNRLANLDIMFNFPIAFPTFGKYEFQLFANEMYIGRQC